ncbi:Na+/H+ antiporter NhaA [Frateuria aurantia]
MTLRDNSRAHSAPATDQRLPGALLILAAVVGMGLANLLPAGQLQGFWQQGWRPFPVGPEWSLQHAVNDGLMTLFFLLAGLEVRLELSEGRLRGPRRAALPVIAALGGVVMPALIYRAFNAGLPQQAGWAIPTATDIAFATGVLALLGPTLAASLRPLLLALAMIDDVLAVLVVFVFYSRGLTLDGGYWLLAALCVYLVLCRWRGWIIPGMALSGLFLWLGFWRCGVHPALAGMLLGLCWLPCGPARWAAARQLMHRLQPLVMYGVMPLYALINASIDLHGLPLGSSSSVRLGLGVVIALVIGKPLGIMLATALATACGVVQRPAQLSWLRLGLMGVLAGIGLTMAMFISGLALPVTGEQQLARFAVVVASLLAVVLAMALGWLLSRYEATRSSG